jgi:histidine ammonia-lyase
MAVTVRDSNDFNLQNYRRVAWANEDVRVHPDALANIRVVREAFLRLLEEQAPQTPIYGVNVGAGDGSNRHLDRDARAGYTTGLHSATSFGKPLPERIVRGIVFARLASFVDGTAAVSDTLTTAVAAMLSEELPKVPADSTGGSGEILPLGHLFAELPQKHALGPKETMSLINGAPCAGALTAEVACRAPLVTALIEDVMTLAIDTLGAPDSHFDPELEQVWGDSCEAAALRAIRTRLIGRETPLIRGQGRVSARIAPRCLAALYRATEALTIAGSTALAHPGDNPAFVARGTPSARIISNGSFHQQQAIVALDQYARSVCDLIVLAQHLLHALYQSELSMPGQDNLSLGVAYMAAAAWSEEARLYATPSLLSFAAVGQNDVPNPLFAAHKKAQHILHCATAQFALLAATASQSYHLTQRAPPQALKDLLTQIRASMPPVTDRRDVGHDIGHLADRFTNMTGPSGHPAPERPGP